MKETPDTKRYFFQLSYVEKPEEIREIAHIVSQYELPEGAHICFGIYLNPNLLADSHAVSHINALLEAAESSPSLVPIVHFSGKENPRASSGVDSETYKRALQEIRERIPNARYIQLNDMPTAAEKELLEASLGLGFRVDIPLADHNFDVLVADTDFTDTVRSNDVFVCLDNSRGSGVQESEDAAIAKIERLLNADIRRIALAGGLGPRQLGLYRSVSRKLKDSYPHIVISTDAETRLRTDGHLDMRKVHVYLHELLLFAGGRFNRPAFKSQLNITPSGVESFKASCDENEIVKGILAEHCSEELRGKRILDIGGGTGDILGAEHVARDEEVIHLDRMDYSHIPMPETHSRIQGDFFDAALLKRITSSAPVDTVFMSHVMQYLDHDVPALSDGIRNINPRYVITVEDTNDDVLGKVLAFSKITFPECNGEEKVPGFPGGYSEKKSFPFVATLRADSFRSLAVQFLYLMDIVPTEERIAKMEVFVGTLNLPEPVVTINQSVNVFEKSTIEN